MLRLVLKVKASISIKGQGRGLNVSECPRRDSLTNACLCAYTWTLDFLWQSHESILWNYN